MIPKIYNCILLKNDNAGLIPPTAKIRQNDIGDVWWENDPVNPTTNFLLKSEGLFPIGKTDFDCGNTSFSNNGDNSAQKVLAAHVDENTININLAEGIEFIQGMTVNVTTWI